MKALLIALAVLMLIPTVLFAGNAAPTLYFEIYRFSTTPVPVPAYVCTHATRPFVGELPCQVPRLFNSRYYVGVHIAKLTNICPEPPGPLCGPYGGTVGVPFGAIMTGEPISFISWTACPGYLKGASNAGEPAACAAYSNSGCKDWMDHTGYLLYRELEDMPGSVWITPGPNADVAHNKVINCSFTYDENTQIGGGVQIGDPKTIVCPSDPTPVSATTWGKIKGLYR